MAEVLFKSLIVSKNIKDIDCESAGLFAQNDTTASQNAINALKEVDLDLSEHRAKNISDIKLGNFDLFVAMSFAHLDALRTLSIPLNKIYVLGNEISDPFGCDIKTYRKCRDEIKIGLQKLLECIENEFKN